MTETERETPAYVPGRRPGWVTTVAVLGIIFGALGIFGSGQSIIMPFVMRMQMDMMQEMESSFNALPPATTPLPTSPADTDVDATDTDASMTPPPGPPAPFGIMRRMFVMPDWFPAWSVVSGGLGLILSVFYIVAGVLLLGMKRGGLTLLYWTLALRIVLRVVGVGMLIAAMSFMLMGLLLTTVLGLVADAVVLVVAAVGDKSAFPPRSARA